VRPCGDAMSAPGAKRPTRARARGAAAASESKAAAATESAPTVAAERTPTAHAAGPALTGALASLLAPIAELAIARGVPFGTLEDLLKAAFVDAARRAQPESAGARIVSRVATATGLTRREVTRLLAAPGAAPPARPSPATQVFTRWQADPALRNRRGQPLALQRTGPAPSFEALARSVTQDVHPRSLLDELCRLGLVGMDGDQVRLLRDRVTAGGDSERAHRFLGNNVGDHLRAAVANVLGATPSHVEQAVFADELSDESMAAFRALADAQWQAVLAATVPALQALVDADAAAGRRRDRRVRIGLYTFHEAMKEGAAAPPEAPVPRAGRRRPAAKDR
jgi:uncharacterized protein DUF6502